MLFLNLSFVTHTVPVLFHSVLFSITAGWLLGTWWIYQRCCVTIDRPIDSKLPFHDPKDPTTAIRRAYNRQSWLPLLATPIIVLLGASVLWLLQRILLRTPDTVALDTSPSFNLFLLSGFPLTLVIYTLIGQYLLPRTPGLELYAAYANVKRGNSGAWDMDVLTERIRGNRANSAYLIPVMWLLAGIPILCGFNCYLQIDSQGIRPKEPLNLFARNYVWKDMTSAELASSSRVIGNGSCRFSEALTIRMRDGRTFIFEEEPKPSAFEQVASTVDVARLLRKHGVPLALKEISPVQEQLLQKTPLNWQNKIHQIWRDVKALPGVISHPSQPDEDAC